MAFEQTFFLASPTGARLRVFETMPEGRARGIVQINHGLAEHAARYSGIAAFLAERGFGTYAHDHRGHGGTTAPDAPRGTFAPEDGVREVLDDVGTVHAYIAKKHPGLPVTLFGHSMGGLIAWNFLLRHSDGIAAAVIWNANFSAGPLGRLAQVVLAYERFRLGSDVPSRLLPRLTFQAWGASIPDARTPFDWLSHDETEVERYIADPACGWDPSVGMWRDVFALIFSGAAAKGLRNVPKGLPIHLAGGSEDPATDGGEAVVQFGDHLRKSGLSDVTTKVHPGFRHETLNELRRGEAMGDLAGWLDMRLSGRRNGLAGFSE